MLYKLLQVGSHADNLLNLMEVRYASAHTWKAYWKHIYTYKKARQKELAWLKQRLWNLKHTRFQLWTMALKFPPDQAKMANFYFTFSTSMLCCMPHGVHLRGLCMHAAECHARSFNYVISICRLKEHCIWWPSWAAQPATLLLASWRLPLCCHCLCCLRPQTLRLTRTGLPHWLRCVRMCAYVCVFVWECRLGGGGRRSSTSLPRAVNNLSK